MRVAKGWGNVPEAILPYDSAWPPVEPPGLDDLAKAMRITHYQRVRTVDDCRLSIFSIHFPVVALEITDQWFTAKHGVITLPTPASKKVGTHSVFVHSYDDNKQMLSFANSWGVKWGDDGHGMMPYSFFTDHVVEAWVSGGEGSSLPGTDLSGILVTNWGTFDIMGGVFHSVDIYDSRSNERIGWAAAVLRDGFLDVEDLFVRPVYRGAGHGWTLLKKVRGLAEKLGLPLRIWIPHSDRAIDNLNVAKRLFGKVGLQIQASGVRWATYKAVEAGTNGQNAKITAPNAPEAGFEVPYYQPPFILPDDDS
jgi:GNAT superfamily N-acetyltransferase